MELAPGPGLTNGRRVVRAVAVVAFGAGLALSGARVVGSRFEPILLVPVVLAAAVGSLMARLPAVVRVIAQAVAFVGSGLLVAYASDGTAADFGRGLLEGPRQVVTTSWPSPRWSTVLVALAALIFVSVAVSIDLAMRIRWRALAVAPLVAGMVAMIAVGAPDGPQWAPLLCAVAGTFALLWIGLDDRVASVRSASVVALLIGVAALAVTVGVVISERANPRRAEAAKLELSLLDPLADVSAQSNADPPHRLYEVESASLPRLHRWRTTALDVYNGESWTTNGHLTPIGNRLGAGSGAEQVSVKVTALRSDTLLWASPGTLLRAGNPVATDADRRIVRILDSSRPAVNEFTVEPLADFNPATAGEMATIQPTDIESSYRQLATVHAGSGTVAEQVDRLAKTLLDEYTLNSRTAGGVQQHLVDLFLSETKVGNVEQFVTGFVLLARSLGVDARIATGYEIDSGSPSDVITTADAVAWPEVRVDEGWVAVDVLPEDSATVEPAQTQAVRPETPPAAQPANPPEVEQVVPDDPVDEPALPPKASSWGAIRVWVLRGALFTGLLLWPLVAFATVVIWKKHRRRKGLKSPDPGRRVTTAWTLATDALIDAGATLQHSHTNAELVEAGVATQPAAGPPLGRLQRHADAVTFATASCDPQRATDAVDQLRLIESSIRNSSTRWWRWKWWLSARSLRRRTQSPLR